MYTHKLSKYIYVHVKSDILININNKHGHC